MAGGGGTLNLSLLSRGIGEVHQNGHEKVEVFLEPEDYFNFVKDPKRLYLPPIQSKYPPPIQSKYPFLSTASTDTSRELKKLELPKTFTTRRGALLLFSEDLAQRNNTRNNKSIGHLSQSVDNLDIKTVDDLAKSILSYGKEEINEDGDVFMGFVHKRRKFKRERQIRPGFSAKRYLSTWTRIWDDSLLENVISKGYITERSLFYGSMVAPSLRRRIFHDDLSDYPQPYRLMRNMLVSPGSLAGYTFYRMDVGQLEQVDEDEEFDSGQFTRQKTQPTIAVIKTKDGVQQEVSYSNLDKQSQKDVLTDLLVKSAVNYALQKQQEFVENMKNPSPEVSHADGHIEAFDMKDAVESLLEVEKENREYDQLSHNAANNLTSPHGPQSSPSWPYDVTSEDKSIIQLPSMDRPRQLSTIEDVSREGTALKVLPPIGQSSGIPKLNVAPPTPKDGSQNRVTQTTEELESDWADGLNEEAMLNKLHSVNEPSRVENGRLKNKHFSTSVPEGLFKAHFASDNESLASSTKPPPMSRPLQKRQWGGSTHSLKSHVSKRSTASLVGDGSLKGSLIAAPGGEILRVGGSVAQSSSQGDVANLVDVTPRKLPETKQVYHVTDESDAEEAEVWPSGKTDKRSTGIYGYRKSRDLSSGDLDATMSLKSFSLSRKDQEEDNLSNNSNLPAVIDGESVTEEGIVNALTEHAQAIAEHILVEGGGQDLENDIRLAANLWMKSHPSRKISRSQSVQDLSPPEAADTVMRAQRVNSAAPTTAEYKELIKNSLSQSVANAAGVDVTKLALESDISDELLEALANQSISPDDVKVSIDPLTGRSQLTTSRSSLKEGHISKEPIGSGKSSGRPPVSIPSARSSVKDIGEVDVISYMPSETIDLSETARSDRSDRSKPASGSSGARSKSSSVKSEGRSKAPSVAADLDTKSVNSQTEENQVEADTQPLPVTEVTIETKEKVKEESPRETVVIPQVEQTPQSVADKTPEPIATEPEPVVQKTPPKVAIETKVTPDKSKSKPVKLEEREQFVVGKLKQEKENENLYGTVESPPKKPSLPKVTRTQSIDKSSEPPKPTTEALPVPDQPDDNETKPIERVPEKPEPVKKPSIAKTPPKTKPAPKPSDAKPANSKPKKEEKEQKKPFIPPPGGIKTPPKPEPPVKPEPVSEKKKEDGKPKEKKVKAPPVPPPKKEEKKKVKPKKGKKGKKTEEAPPPPPPVEEVKKPPEPTPPPTKTTSPGLDSSRSDSRDFASPESDGMEFVIIRDRSPTPTPPPPVVEATPSPPNQPPPPPELEPEEDEEEDTKLNMISSKDARVAKRAAAAAKRREEVERKRKEREEELRREKEKQDRERQREMEAEEARRRQEEQRKLRKQQEEADRMREELESREREKRRVQEIEREKRMKEERQRKFDEMRRKQLEDEQKRLELLLLRQAEEEEQWRLEEEKKSQMEEQERLDYERRMREEEELRKQKEALEKQRREEEAARLMEEERQKAIAEARKRMEFEERLKFNRSLQLEAHGLSEHSHQISEAFVFSYYEILQWLGLDIPEFELQKLQQLN